MNIVKTLTNAFLLILSMFFIPIAAMEQVKNEQNNMMNETSHATYSRQGELNALLIEAAKKGNKNLVEWCLYKGANINAKDNYGDNALHCTCRKGYIEIVKLLLACNGTDINAKNNGGYTALHIACLRKRTEIVKLLLACNGIDINAKNNDGWAALNIACMKDGREQLVELLVENGINIFAAYCENRTALNYSFFAKKYLTNVKNEFENFMNDPCQISNISIETGLNSLNFIKIIHNLGKNNISYKQLMYWFSKMYLNPELMNIGEKLDQCKFNKFNKNDKSLMTNAHNVAKNSWELAFQSCLLHTLSEKEPYPEFDLNFIYKNIK